MSANDALDQGALLSDATMLSLQLHHQPFTTDPEDAASHDSVDASQATLFSDAVTDEQLADIKQALITGDDLLLILGEKGAGKSTLLHQLEANSGLRIQCFPVTGNDRFSTLNLFTGMLQAFKVKPPETLKGVLDELIPCLQTMVGRNTLGVVLLDDAHLASQNELTHLLSGMLYMNSQDETLIRVALAASNEFEDLIPDLLPEGSDLPYSSLAIEGFSPQRAAAYLDYRLQLAGFDQEFPFTDRDMASLVDHSAGRPAELHSLTADVLNEKYGALEPQIPKDLITDNNGGFLQSRAGKLALGAVATVLILGGILMFMPTADDTNLPPARERVDVAQQNVAQQTITPVAPPVVPAPTQPAIVPNTTEQAFNQSANNAASNLSNTATELANANSAQNNSGLATTVENNASAVATDAASSVTAAQTAAINRAREQITEAVDTANDSNSNTANATSNTTPSTSTAQTDTAAPADTVVEPQAPIPQAPAPEVTQPETTQEPAEQIENVASPDLAADITDLSDVLESPSWILVQDESLFTIQMSASTDLPSVQNFLRRNPLPAPNSIFSFERDGAIWYALVHGVFPSVADARLAVEQMSTDAQRDQPWIRSISRIKGILLEE